MTPHDNALLQRWAQSRDAEAFSEIVTRYTDLVYSTAKRILRNDIDAEDVTQECFLRLAERPRQVRTSLAGWLHATATGRARDFLKAESRRRGRQQRFAARLPNAAEASWDDIQGYVDEAIEQLPEKQRQVIVAHFLQRQTHDAIARELGVTRPAVSYHVQKGVESLRACLDKKGVVITSAFLLAGLSSELTEAAPVELAAKLGKLALAGTGGAGVAGGSFAGKGLITCTTAILLALFGAWWVASGPRVVDEVEPPLPAEAAVSRAVTGLEDGPPIDVEAAPAPVATIDEVNIPGTTRTPAAAPAPSKSAGAVEGVVVNEHGTPVAGATIHLQKRPEDESALDEPAVAMTAQDGSFRVDAVAANLPAIYAENPHYAPGWTAIHPAPGHTEQVRIVLATGGTIEGQLTVGGQPSSGSVAASLYCVIRTVVVGPDGAYRLERITPGTVDVIAFVNRHRNEIRTAIVEPGLTTVVDFDFPAVEATIQGRVTLGTNPVSHAILRLSIQTEGGIVESYTTSTNGEGAFRFEQMPGGTAHMAAYATRTSEPHSRKSVTFTVAPTGETVQNMELTPGPCAVSGAVEIPCDDCRAAVSVLQGDVVIEEFTMSALAGLDSQSVGHTIQPPGTFRFAGLDPGTYTLMALIYPASPDSGTDVMGEALIDTLVLQLEAGQEATAELYPEPVAWAAP